MAERRTKEVLLRLRQAREIELRRDLSLRRAERAEARQKTATAEAERLALEQAIARAESRVAERWSAPRAAGRAALAEAYRRGLRADLGGARRVERRAGESLDGAEAELAAAQSALGEAVQARQRSEQLARTEEAARARARERREQTEIDDRFATPRRPRSR